MNTCVYCGSLVIKRKGQYYCDFCELEIKKPLQDGHRSQSVPRFIVDEKKLALTTSQLFCLQTYELLLLLRMARKERGDTFSYLKTFRRAVKTGLDEYQEYEAQQGEQYTYYTRKVWILENILQERLGYIPNRITGSFLNNYYEKCTKPVSRPMIIREKQRNYDLV